MNWLTQIWCRLRGHAWKFNGGRILCRRCGMVSTLRLLPPTPSADAVTRDYVDGQYQYGADATPWWAAGE